MSISVFPAPVAATGPNKWSYTAATANIPYGADSAFPAGFYTITCVSSTIAKVQFFSNKTTEAALATTASGTVTIYVPVNCTRVVLWTNTGSSILVNIENTSKAIANDIGTLGSLETITTNTTYTNTSTSGYAFVIAVGGGGGGGGGGNSTGAPWLGGTGGGSAGVACGVVQLTGSVPITIGNGGAGGGNQANGSTGGTTTIGSLTATGGGGGNYARNGGSSGGTGGSPGGVTAISSAANQSGNAGAAGVNPYTFVTGSAVMGTGGAGATTNAVAPSGTLGGGGGGASASFSNAGGTGGNGVVYIIRY